MKSGFRIGRIISIPIELHASWFLIFGLLTWSLATGLLPQEYPELSAACCSFTSSAFWRALASACLAFT